jgi:hypothetical protein
MLPAPATPSRSDPVSACAEGVTIHGLERHVDPAPGKTREFPLPRRIPGELAPRAIIVPQVGLDTPPCRFLPDYASGFGGTWDRHDLPCDRQLPERALPREARKSSDSSRV